MLTRILFCLALALSGLGVLSGAWFGTLTSSPQAAEVAFVPQIFSLDDEIIGSGINAKQLLARATAKWSPEQTVWMRTKIRQTMDDADRRFVAAGLLQRGPHHCARLEMEVIVHGARAQLVVVSDGERLAQVRSLPGAPPAAVIEKLPTDDAAAEGHLVSKGCGGPRYLLQHFHEHLQGGELQTGLLGDRPVIQIKGVIAADVATAFSGSATSIRSVAAYLDAKTLWPHRFDWCGSDPARPVLRIDFHDAELDRKLDLEQCSEVFSYRAVGHEKVTEK